MDRLPAEVSNFFLAMQAGRAGAETLRAVFAQDAIYEEPFSGETRCHEGREAILAAMATGWERPLPEMHIRIDHVETDGARIRVDWTCLSLALPGGAGRGSNHYVMRDGLIAELRTVLTGEGEG